MPRPTPRRAAAKKRPAKGRKAPTNYTDIQRPGEDEPVGPQPGPAPPPGSGEGGGGGQPQPPPDDLGIPGLPPEVANRIHQIFASGREDWRQQAISYLMTTPWFKQEYAGYDVGYHKSMFADPLSGGLAQYRQYKTQVQGHYRQYYGRDLTVQDITGLITQGYDAGRVGQMGQGYATVQAQQGDWQYLAGAFGGGQLTEEEKKAYGEQTAGIETELGQRIKSRVETSLQRMQRIFQGQAAGSMLGDQSLSKGLQKKPDISA